MAGCVNESHVDRTDRDDVAGIVADEMIGGHPCRPLHPRTFSAVHMNRHGTRFEKARYSFDAHSHHRSSDVIRVVMGGEYSIDSHAIGGGNADEFVDCVCGVDHQTRTCLAIADDVDEIDHLSGHWIIDCEVVSGQKLAKVQAVVHAFRIEPRRDNLRRK